MKIPTCFTPPTILEQLMQQKRCIAYVGAGFSRTCGMPDWAGLIERLIEFGAKWLDAERLALAKAAFAARDFPMASSVLKEILTPALVNECLGDTFGSAAYARCPEEDRLRMRRRMSDLVRSTWAGIITTNYDGLIEHALAEATEGTQWVDDVQVHGDTVRLAEALIAAGQDRLFFAKLHGSLSGQRVVLTTEEYDEAYLRSPQITAFLQAVMLQYHLIFIGCSLEDEVVRLRRRLTGDFAGHIPLAYALLPGESNNSENQARARYLKRQASIDVIWFRSDDAYKGVDEFLRYLAELPKPPEDIRSLLRFQRYEDRQRRLSPRNKRLLQYVAAQTDKSITLTDLLSRLDSEESLKTDLCAESLEDEMKYRLLYLAAVGLLTEIVESDTFRYAVPASALRPAPATSAFNLLPDR